MSNLKTFIVTNAWIIVVLLVALIVLIQFVDPAPPRKLTIATGHEDGRYYRLARSLQADLRAQGITLNIVTTAGSRENMELLLDEEGEVSIAFMQSGIEENFPESTDNIYSLGSLYYEPIWLFYREGHKPEHLSDLIGKRIAIGEAGSGTQVISEYLLAENGLLQGLKNTELLPLDNESAVAQLKSGGVDLAFFTVSPQSEIIQNLLAIPGVDFLNVTRANAYTARYPFLSAVTISEGLLDLQKNIPDTDRTTLASTATVVVNDRFHPSLTPLLLDFFHKHLRAGGVLEKPRAFPSAINTGFPLTAEAQHYYEYGPPFLLRFLPFWLASLVDRLVILVIPFLFVLIPLFKLAGPVYRWRIRSRIYRWYRFLLEIDRNIAENTLENPEEVRKKVADMANELATIDVPLSYADELYHLKQHVEYIGRRLKNL
ncbi:TRAP transporter TAXI family solute receptor [Alteromonadaceae bacterium 2753L.S.0a.02]|nr:TRAP transporter TAXI family solute receptor [Alteromonadaceae bacterium 2753L.S.0a.02]